MKVRWLARAADDLEHLFSHVARHHPDAAADEARRVVDAIERLGNFPASGRPGRVPNTRELVVSSYIIAYRVKDEVVQVLRILHAARRWPEKLP